MIDASVAIRSLAVEPQVLVVGVLVVVVVRERRADGRHVKRPNERPCWHAAAGNFYPETRLGGEP
jgi:hypothetical protein